MSTIKIKIDGKWYDLVKVTVGGVTFVTTEARGYTGKYALHAKCGNQAYAIDDFKIKK